MFLPEGLTSVGRNWFAGSRVTKVFIPASVAELDDYAFAWCAQLSEVVFEKSSALRRMGEGCFYDSGLKQISIP